MKRILYDMGPLTLVRWLLQRALKFEPPFGPRSKLKRVPPTKKMGKNKCALKWLLCKIQCFKPIFFFLIGTLAVVERNFTIFFLNPSLILSSLVQPYDLRSLRHVPAISHFPYWANDYEEASIKKSWSFRSKSGTVLKLETFVSPWTDIMKGIFAL